MATFFLHLILPCALYSDQLLHSSTKPKRTKTKQTSFPPPFFHRRILSHRRILLLLAFKVIVSDTMSIILLNIVEKRKEGEEEFTAGIVPVLQFEFVQVFTVFHRRSFFPSMTGIVKAEGEDGCKEGRDTESD